MEEGVMHIPVVQVFFWKGGEILEEMAVVSRPHVPHLSLSFTPSCCQFCSLILFYILIPGGFATKMTVKGKRNQEEDPGVVGREAPRLEGPESSFGEKLIGGKGRAGQRKL